MRDDRVYPVILAGGVGERFWPCSRAGRPKQLLPLLSAQSLLQETLTRARALAPDRNILIVTSEFLIAPISASLRNRTIELIGEPVGKNTAPAIAAAASWVTQRDPEGVLVVMPSDHDISPLSKFTATFRSAVQTARQGPLVVAGVKPSRPETGYGYIRFGAREGRAFRVERFCEKPDPSAARRYLRSGTFFWNCGIFTWKASAIRNEFKRQMPKLHGLSLSLDRKWDTPGIRGALRTFYRKAESKSIDYGILEGARNVAMVKLLCRWDDVGAWDALWRIRPADSKGNVAHGRTLSVDNRNSLLFADGGLVVGAGLNDMVVVQSNNVTLVLPRSYLKNMKKIVSLVRGRKDLARYLE